MSKGFNVSLSNNFIGVGMSNPVARLDVYDNANWNHTMVSGGNSDTVPFLATLHDGPGTSFKNWNDSLYGFGFFYDTTGLFKLNRKENQTGAGTNVLTITRGGGNVGIGTTGPQSPLHVLNTSSRNTISDMLTLTSGNTAFGSGGGAAIRFSMNFFDNNNNYGLARIRAVDNVSGTSGYGSLAFDTENNYVPTERMRITHVGNVGIGTTAPGSTLHVNGCIAATGGGNIIDTSTSKIEAHNGNIMLDADYRLVWWYNWSIRASNGGSMQFYYGNNPHTNTISTAYIANTGQYNVGSDARLKKNIEPLEYGLHEVLQLQPKKYNMNNEENGTSKRIGFIAQDVLPLIPEVVGHVDDEKTTLSLSYSELIPVLVKAIQEQNIKLETQQTQIEALLQRVCKLEQNGTIAYT